MSKTRHHRRRVWLKPAESSPLDRATSVGVALPSFNFIEPKVPKRPPALTNPTVLPSLGTPRRNHSSPSHAASGRVDGDEIVYRTLLRWSQQLSDPTVSEESKMARLWQALQRHSEAGRFSSLTDYVPNPICSLMAIEILQKILEASGISLMLTNLLVGAIGNSIFQGYDVEKNPRELKQHADAAKELNEQLTEVKEELASCKKQMSSQISQLTTIHLEEQATTSEDKAQLAAAILGSIDEPTQVPQLVVEVLSPFFSDELLLLLWNATAKRTVSQDLARDDSISEADEQIDSVATVKPKSFSLHRKRASVMATRVLHERVRLMLVLWQTLSLEEKDVLSKCLTPSLNGGDSLSLEGVLRTLEEVYVSEQLRDRSAIRRSMYLSPMTRHSSVVLRPPSTGSGSDSPRATTITKARSRQRMLSTRFPPRDDSQLTQVAEPTAPNASIPDVLLGALSEGQHVAATEEHQLLIEQLSNEQDDILRQCEEVFDLLCEELPNNNRPSLGTGESPTPLLAAKQRLCELLCDYVDTPSFIMEKFEKSEDARLMQESVSQDLDDINNSSSVVRTLIQRQRQNPTILVNAINQSPEILLSAITQNNGILRFAITKFAPLVKRFLRLDLKACEYLDALAYKNKGVQLLWGSTPNNGAPVATPNTLGAVGSQRSSAALGAVSDVLEEMAGRRSSTLDGGRGSALTQGEVQLAEWFTAHTDDLVAVALKRPEFLKHLFVELHDKGDVGSFYKVMVQLSTTKGVQNFIQRASVVSLEKIAQEDSAEIGRLLREMFKDPANRDLLDQLQSSPYLATCLSEFHPTAIQDVISSDLETWKHYFVETVAASDTMLKETLIARTEHLAGGETLVSLFTAVVAGTTAGLKLEALDFAASPSDIAVAREREGASRRKRAQCLYLRGGSSVFRALISQSIATVGYHPHEHFPYLTSPPTTSCVSPSLDASSQQPRHVTSSSLAAAHRMRGKKARRGSSGSPIKKRPHHSVPKKDDSAPVIEADTTVHSIPDDVAPLDLSHVVENLPHMWRSFVVTFERHHQQHDFAPEFHVPTLSRAHTKTFILDLWIEFLKVDTAQLDNACLWSLAPFVCDYLVTRYDSPVVVGAWIVSLSEAIFAFHDDPRVAFFATSCGIRTSGTVDMVNDGYDTFLYYAHALGHLLFGQMKIFKAECRLEETPDGGCPISKQSAIATAARLFDHRLLSGPEINDLLKQVEELSYTDSDKVELDDLMEVFLVHWRLVNGHVDERYRQAFVVFDASASNRIGLEQFIKVVASVTQHRVSPRECLLVFCDVGQELLDLDTLLRVTHVYHLRLFNSGLQELLLDEADLHELKQSVGRTNIFSMTREIEDLQRFWRGLRVEVHLQIEALHQSRNTKMHLKKQSALIERLLHDIQSTAQQPSGVAATSNGIAGRPKSQQQPSRTTSQQALQKAWTELRACAKLLQSAKLTQHYLSRLYIQTCIVRWVRQVRRRQLLSVEAVVNVQEEGDVLQIDE